MLDWNIVATVVPGPGHMREVIGALCNLGTFQRAPSFKNVCIGRVADTGVFLDMLGRARDERKHWAIQLVRVITVECRFVFEPDDLVARACEAIEQLVQHLDDGSFHVRLERRGMAAEIDTRAVERAVADHVIAQLGVHGRILRVDFTSPDTIIAVETIGCEGGVGLITREMRTRYPLVQPR